MKTDAASRDDEIDWDVVPPPPTTAFDRIQTRTVQVARSGRRRLPESRRTAALVAGIVLMMAIALAATWWVRRPPPGADNDLLVRLAATSETFTPSYVTTSREQAESYVADVFGWSIGLPEIPGFRVAGVGEAALSPQLSVPAVRYDGPDGATVIVFAYDYAFLEESGPALDLPEATYAQLAEPDPVDTRRLDDAALVSWRRRAVLYTAVTGSDEAFELLGRAVAAPQDAPPPAAPGVPTDSSTAPPLMPDYPAMPRPTRVLMTTPDHFRVAYVINPHMEGHIGTVDHDRAQAQWEALRAEYVRLGLDVTVVDGASGQPDMVFCANQTLPALAPDGSRVAVMSRMNAPERTDEVPAYTRFFEADGYDVLQLDADLPGTFEGMGDAIWHPGRRLLWGGYGFRTDRQVYDRLATALGTAVIPLALHDPEFYHLDTCFCALDEQTVLVYPGAFTPGDLATIRAHFERVIEAPEDEARTLFACNAHSPDGQTVIIQRGCTVTNERLREAGFEVVEVDTDEYLKSGGSVFCMKLMFW